MSFAISTYLERSRSSTPYLQASRRYSHSFHNETASGISKPNNNVQFCNKDISGNVTTNQKHDRQPDSRKSGNLSQLPVQLFSNTKTRWVGTSNLQPEKIEQFRKSRKFSTIQSLPDTVFPTKQGLDGEIRFEPGLFSSANRASTSQISQNELRRIALSNDVSTFWFIISAQDICDGHKLDSGVSKKQQNTVCCLPRRLPAGQPILRAASASGNIYNMPAATSRMGDQLRQICSGSDTTPRISRCYLGHTEQFQIPVGTKVPDATHGITKTDVERQLVPQTGPVPNGETQLCLLRCPQRATSLSNHTIPQSTFSEKSPSLSGDDSETSSYRDGMVDEDGNQHITDTFETHLTSTHDGCIRYRLGSPTRTHEISRSVDNSSAILACELQGVICSPRSSISRTTIAQKCSYITTVRQSNCCSIHKQGGWNAIKEPSEVNQTTASSIGPIKCTSDCTISPRPIQYRGRRIVTQENSPRMASPRASDESHIQNVGDAGGGSVCIRDSSRRSQVCSIRSRRKSPNSQCFSASLELQPRLAISTAKSDTASAVTSELCPRSVHINSSEMEQTFLDSRPTTASSSTTIPDTRFVESLNRHKNWPASARDEKHTLGSMVDSRWLDLIQDWSEEEKSLLLTSWKKSTIRTYITAWNKWKKWCIGQSVDFKDPPPSSVARYLAYLHNNQRLAYRTILVHKSAISTFTKTSEQNISSNFLVKQILKAISTKNLKSPKPPIWNPRVLLKFLKNQSPDEENFFHVSKRTAILLLLASGRRVHDLTLLRCDPEHLIDEGHFIIMWPAFGSKTDSAIHRQSGWKVTQHPEKNLNIVYWIRRLLVISQERRNEGKFLELFITPRRQCKPASRTIIGGWIKSVLREAGIEATPGSVRSAVSSLNWLENYPIDQILATGNWKQEHTFRNYYQRQIRSSDDIDLNKELSLSQYFEAV